MKTPRATILLLLTVPHSLKATDTIARPTRLLVPLLPSPKIQHPADVPLVAESSPFDREAALSRGAEPTVAHASEQAFRTKRLGSRVSLRGVSVDEPAKFAERDRLKY